MRAKRVLARDPSHVADLADDASGDQITDADDSRQAAAKRLQRPGDLALELPDLGVEAPQRRNPPPRQRGLDALLAGQQTLCVVEAEGVVPDQVAKLALVLSAGETIPVTVEGNAFSVHLPDGSVITGEQVEMTNGTTFFNEDHVTVD
jgi:hypothetical protein